MIKKNIAMKKINDDDILKMEGKFFNDNNILIFKENVDVYTESGKLLLKFRKNVLSDNECKILLNSKGAAASVRRPGASGIDDGSDKYKWVESKKTGKKLYIVSNSKKVNSGIIGFYDSISNFGNHHYNKSDIKCRLTSYTSKYMNKFEECLPVFQKIDNIYKEIVPDFYDIQKNAICKINSMFVIENTIFTTVTVNKNFQTALHKDIGDLKDGFGNLIVVSDGEYTGGYTMFPQYGIGVDCRNGDFLAMDVHEWHCNSEIKGTGIRVSFVFYLREKMLKSCPSIDIPIKTKIKYKSKISAFTLFSKDERINIQRENIKLTSREVMKEIANRWNSIKINNIEKVNYYNKLIEEYNIKYDSINNDINNHNINNNHDCDNIIVNEDSINGDINEDSINGGINEDSINEDSINGDINENSIKKLRGVNKKLNYLLDKNQYFDIIKKSKSTRTNFMNINIDIIKIFVKIIKQKYDMSIYVKNLSDDEYDILTNLSKLISFGDKNSDIKNRNNFKKIIEKLNF